MSSEDVVLPLPKFRVSVDHAFNARWIGHAGIDVFELEIGGSLVDFRATLDYRITNNFSIGAGWQGGFDWETRGLMAYGQLNW